jgi:hypothetical protein
LAKPKVAYICQEVLLRYWSWTSDRKVVVNNDKITGARVIHKNWVMLEFMFKSTAATTDINQTGSKVYLNISAMAFM